MPLLTTGAGRFPVASAAAFNTIFSDTLDTDDGGWSAYTLVQKYAVGQLSHNGSKIRFRLVPPSGGAITDTIIDAMYVGYAAGSGDAYDFEATPTAVTVGSSGSFTLTKGGASVVTDDITFTVDATKALMVAINSNASGDYLFKKNAGNANLNVYYKAGADAATVDKSGYTDYGNKEYLIDRIEAYY